LPVTRNRLEAALFVFIFGMGLSDLAAAPVGPTHRVERRFQGCLPEAGRGR